MTNSAVNDWFESAPESQRMVLSQLREIVLATGIEIEESIKWSRPCYATGKGLFCYLHRSKKHVTLGFQKGASLKDPDGILDGQGKDMRHVKITSSEDINRIGFKRLLEQAYKLRR